ncbi:hypothetical protein [Arachnia propionica]|uniref:hypothetical protein n=1 Tax=Arachnia propionica TaxID=1750 RepID=UPI00163989AE|nr:hypothetical protein [Arachnia propionica]
MAKKVPPFVVLIGLLISFLSVVAPAARAETPPTRVVHMTLLGDSYSAGNGAGDYDTAA